MRFPLGFVLVLLLIGWGEKSQCQNLSPLIEPCVTGPDCRCACTLHGKTCLCIKKCATEAEKIKELVP